MDKDKCEFEEFFKSTYVLMLNYCKSMGLKHEDADEIANEAFVRIWRMWDKCAELDPVDRKKWLYNAINYIILERYKKREPLVENIDDYSETLAVEASDQIMEAFENYKYDIYIKRVTIILTPIECKLFISTVIDGLTYKESADKLGININYVYVLMTRIRKKIRKSKRKIFI